MDKVVAIQLHDERLAIYSVSDLAVEHWMKRFNKSACMAGRHIRAVVPNIPAHRLDHSSITQAPLPEIAFLKIAEALN